MQEHKQKDASKVKIKDIEGQYKKKCKEVRQLKQALRDTQKSRGRWKRKYQEQKPGVSERNCQQSKPTSRAKGYRYSNHLIKMSVALYLLLGCGYRGIVKILLYFELEFGIIGSVPSKSIISQWVEKLGCYKYEQRAWDRSEGYGIILDECMVIGRQRLVIALIMKSNKDTNTALSYGDVELFSMSVRPSWKGSDIAKLLKEVQEKTGKKASYVISDSGSNLRKGITDAAIVRIRDVSHQIALLIEKTYKHRPDFESWQKDMSLSKFKGIMQDHAYLLPPKQRVIARFMNVNTCVEWANKMLLAWQKLDSEEEEKMQWVKKHQDIIVELTQVFQITQELINTLKLHGLSYESIQKCKTTIEKSIILKHTKLKTTLLAYLEDEQSKLPSDKVVWHCSTEVLESVFGKLKEILPTNPLCGISGVSLSLPLRMGNGLNSNIQEALEDVSLAKLQQWKTNNLPSSQVVRRCNLLNS